LIGGLSEKQNTLLGKKESVEEKRLGGINIMGRGPESLKEGRFKGGK